MVGVFENMELTLEKVEEEFANKNYKEVYILLNIYNNLIKQVRDKAVSTADIIILGDRLDLQLNTLYDIRSENHYRVGSELVAGNYRDADIIIDSIEKVEKARRGLEQLLINY